MQAKVGKILIAKDIARTGSLVIGGSTENLAEGEVVVLDENRKIASAGITYADSKKLYVVEGLGETFSYVDPSSTSITCRKLLYSDAIDGAGVANYSGSAYTAPVEATFTLSGSLTPVVNNEYVLRVVYKDMEEHPGQFTYTYRVIASSTSLTTLYTDFVAAINGHKGARITASSTSGPDILTIVAKAYNDNESVDSLNEYKQVNPFLSLLSNDFGSVVITKTVNPKPGKGTWKLVRDEEKWSQGYEGATNRIKFPIILPTFRTVKNETYDCIVIKHNNWYTAADRKEEQVDITTKIFVPNTATTNQMDSILAVLNPWMASLPNAFNNVSF
jgi:hypothetical protein